MKKNSVVVATFAYDGDGQRVKATVNGVTTAFVGDDFEWKGSTSTMVKHYSAGGQRVAMRVGSSTRYYLLTDRPSPTLPGLAARTGRAGLGRQHGVDGQQQWLAAWRAALQGLRGDALHLGHDADQPPVHGAAA